MWQLQASWSFVLAIEDFVKIRTIALEQGEEACTSLLHKMESATKAKVGLKKG